jgi:hypothetical protein
MRPVRRGHGLDLGGQTLEEIRRRVRGKGGGDRSFFPSREGTGSAGRYSDANGVRTKGTER